jgi:hypothetical protein
LHFFLLQTAKTAPGRQEENAAADKREEKRSGYSILIFLGLPLGPGAMLSRGGVAGKHVGFEKASVN